MFVVAAVVAVLTLTLIYVFKWFQPPKSPRASPLTVPGVDPTSEEDGNCTDITKAGSLHAFLVDLHAKFGPIASFWYGKVHYVSIASPQLFREHNGPFDRPEHLFLPFLPIMGAKSITFANGSDGKTRRKYYDRVFTHDMLPLYCASFQKSVEGILKEWLSFGPDDKLDAVKYANHYAIKSALWGLLGDDFEDDEAVARFRDAYEATILEMQEEYLESSSPQEGSSSHTRRQEALNIIRKTVMDAVKQRSERSLSNQGNLFLDVAMEISPDDDTVLGDAVSYTIGGFHTTAFMLSWAFYYISTNSHVQDKLYQEIMEILGEDGTVDETNFSDFKYMIQVIEETMRCSVLAPFAARTQQTESQLGGYTLPAGTPVVHAIGVVHQDNKTWPEPTKFDPDRFSPENKKKNPPYAFSPFGFAGKRICPGYKFSYWESVVFFATILRRFHISCCNEQEVKPCYGFVTRPETEVWLKVTQRK